MKHIAVVGVGYVGLVSAAGFADLGNRVIALDINEERIKDLKKGIMPIYEPGLDELVERNVASERLSFTTSYPEAINGADFVFIAVGTPSGVDGEADLKYVRIRRASDGWTPDRGQQINRACRDGRLGRGDHPHQPTQTHSIRSCILP